MDSCISTYGNSLITNSTESGIFSMSGHIMDDLYHRKGVRQMALMEHFYDVPRRK